MASEVYSKANDEYVNENYQRAVELYSEALVEDNKNENALVNRAQAYLKLNQYQDAIQDCDKALVLNSKNVKAFLRKGTALFYLEDYRKALDTFKEGATIAVFRGMVIGVKEDEAEDPEDPEEIYFNMYGDKVYTVRVDQAFVMPPDVTISENNTLELRTNKQGSMCGSYFPLRADNRIFFANTYGGDEARTHLCTPNTLWDNLDTEDQELIASNLAEFCSNHKQGIPIPNDITHEDTDTK